MTSIFDVAKYILYAKEKITSWELQKLCYYSKAWSLALGEGAMFPEQFEAWKDGPASRSLFAERRGEFYVGKRDLYKGDRDNAPANAEDIIKAVLTVYKDMNGDALRSQTYKEEPWIAARRGLPDGVSCNNEINENLMMSYYRKSDLFPIVDNLVMDYRARRRLSSGGKEYSMSEVVGFLGISLEDLNYVEYDDIEFD
ncbi:MAG: DUF4065 domain-containing protein [Lachnospiraceae bacterium]|nr:DUF4065 domain-containing protein [Lachnospiraceae bacterium]